MTMVQVPMPVEVKTAPKKKSGNIDILPARIKRVQLMHLSRQLASFLRAGIPILDAVETIAADGKPAVNKVMTQVAADLREGLTLSEAVDKHPKDFPLFYRGILASAELTGNLETVLEQLSAYIERDLEARRKVKSAMIYPTIIASMALMTVVVLSVFVLPKFETFFASLDAELPLPTRMLLATTAFMSSWWWLIGSVAAGVALLVFAVNLTNGGKKMFHHMWLRTPVIGSIIKHVMIERFSRMVSSMVAAGVMLPEAIQVATAGLGNKVFEDALKRVRTQLMEGKGLADPMLETGLFPGVAAQMIRVGEDTGSLETQLEVTAGYYAKELDYKILKATTLLEPLVIIGMGGMVGFVAIALVSAMYGIFNSAGI